MIRAAAAALASALALAFPAAAAAAPALWMLEDDDTRIYLFGTVHDVPSELEWRNETIDRAIDESDMLVTEVDIGFNPFNSLGYFAEAAFDPSLPPVRERIDPSLHDAFAQKVAASDYPESFYDKLDTWAVAEFLSSVDTFEGYDSGVEIQLQDLFDTQGKPREHLETVQFQVTMSDRHSPALQRHSLEYVLTETDPGEAGLRALIDEWVKGKEMDLETLFGAVDPDYVDARPDLTEEEMDVLLYSRNRNWVEWLGERLERPGTVFMAVGAAHLGGARSVIDYLEKGGYAVKRVQ